MHMHQLLAYKDTALQLVRWHRKLTLSGRLHGIGSETRCHYHTIDTTKDISLTIHTYGVIRVIKPKQLNTLVHCIFFAFGTNANALQHKNERTFYTFDHIDS